MPRCRPHVPPILRPTDPTTNLVANDLPMLRCASENPYHPVESRLSNLCKSDANSLTLLSLVVFSFMNRTALVQRCKADMSCSTTAA